MKKPFILITNDDGVMAKGLQELIAIARKIGDVLVIAPDTHRSGQSSALTITTPLLYHDVSQEEGLQIIACTGTPVDCVKLGFSQQLPNASRKPDLVLSGINHGSNAAINVIYSGTMGAAIEGALYQVPSIGFSLCDHAPNANFSHLHEPFTQIINRVLEVGIPVGTCLNVNAPTGEIEGIKLCRQAKGYWRKEFMASPMPHGNKVCYWLTGEFINQEKEASDTDEWALAHNYISVQPVHADMTHFETLERLTF